jgi:hypothetical protein
MAKYFIKVEDVLVRFFPGERDWDYEYDSSFGNWWRVKPDPRTYEELLKADKVVGMVQNEGGNARVVVSGSEIIKKK